MAQDEVPLGLPATGLETSALEIRDGASAKKKKKKKKGPAEDADAGPVHRSVGML